MVGLGGHRRAGGHRPARPGGGEIEVDADPAGPRQAQDPVIRRPRARRIGSVKPRRGGGRLRLGSDRRPQDRQAQPVDAQRAQLIQGPGNGGAAAVDQLLIVLEHRLQHAPRRRVPARAAPSSRGARVFAARARRGACQTPAVGLTRAGETAQTHPNRTGSSDVSDGLGGFSDGETSPSRRQELPISTGHDRDLRGDGCCQVHGVVATKGVVLSEISRSPHQLGVHPDDADLPPEKLELLLGSAQPGCVKTLVASYGSQRRARLGIADLGADREVESSQSRSDSSRKSSSSISSLISSDVSK